MSVRVYEINTTTKWRLLWLCPMPKPLPKSFSVDKQWSFKNQFDVHLNRETLGNTARTFLSPTSEIGLRNNEGDLWGVARRPFLSRDLIFYDCIGDELVRFTGNWKMFGSAPACEVLNADGDLIGHAAVNTTLSKGGTTVMDVKSVQGRPVVQFVQRWSWYSVTTDVTVFIEPDSLVNAKDSADPRLSPVNPLVDTRVLALYSSMQFGASALFIGGFFLDVSVLVLLAGALLCCLRHFACRRRRAPDAKSTVFLLERREEALKALEQIDDELIRQRSNRQGPADMWSLRCCSRPNRPLPPPASSKYAVCPRQPLAAETW